MDVIQVQSLSKDFGLLKAVNNISFSVKKGEIFGFLGPNGAGKTTTIRMLTGVLKPSAGKILINGLDAWQNQLSIKQLMGNVPEMANVYLDLTGFQNLMFIGGLYGVPKDKRLKRAGELLKKFGLYNKKDNLTKKYSKGMKQRLLLCMALMSKPKILFLDEPTSGLDVQSSIIIKKLIKEYNKNGMTIFLTTHDMEVADELCNRIAIMNKGVILKLGAPKDLRNIEKKYQLIDLELSHRINKHYFMELSMINKVKIIGKNHYRLFVKDLNKAIYQIIKLSKTHKVNINEINTPKPSLEEIFIKTISGGVD